MELRRAFAGRWHRHAALLRALVGVLMVGVLLAGWAYAQESEDEQPPKPPQGRLDEIVVTATRTERSSFDVPSTIDVVTSDDVRDRRLSRTLPEALNEQPGVMVQKTGRGQGSPFIRGFTGFRTLLLIDGIRLNNSVFREGPNQYWNTVDPLTLDRLEIVKGPGSVLYGSDAIGGTVNAITRSPELQGDRFWWKRRLYTRFASAENSSVWRAEIEGGTKDFGFLLGGSFKDFGDLHAGGDTGHLPHTGYDEWDGDIKLEYMLTPTSKLVFAHYRVDQDDAWRTHRTIYGKSWHGTTVGNELEHPFDQDHELTYLKYSAWDLDSFADRMELTLSYQTQKETEFVLKNDRKSERQGFRVDTPGLSVQFESPTSLGTWTYGLEYYRDTVSSFKRKYKANGSLDTTEIQGPVADDATYDLLGLFVQDEIAVTQAVDLILGARYTYARLDADAVKSPTTGNRISISDNWDTIVSSARLLYHLDQERHYNLFAGVSQGFRAPNLSDLTRLDTARTKEFEIASPGLKPEKFVSYEIGFKAKHEAWSGQVAYFITDIQDMIVRAPTGNVDASGNFEVTKRNAGDGYINGIELESTYRFHPQFTAFGSITWQHGRVDAYPTSQPITRSEPMSRLMPPTANLGVRWDHPGRRYWVEMISTMADAQHHLSTEDKRDTQRIPPGGTPGYAVFTIRSGCRITEQLTLSAAIENILDKDYRIHGSGQNEPGRNFVLGLDWTF